MTKPKGIVLLSPPKSQLFFCCICGVLIVKYQLDLEDTVCLNIKKEWKYVCDNCSHKIAEQRISR